MSFLCCSQLASVLLYFSDVLTLQCSCSAVAVHTILHVMFQHFVADCTKLLWASFAVLFLVPSCQAINNVADLDQIRREIVSNRVPLVNGHPTEVSVGVYVESLSGMDTTNDGELGMNVFLRLSWTDPALRGLSGLVTNPKAPWGYRPDIVFFNAREAQFHPVTVDNFSFRIYENGTVAYSTRLDLVVSCPMDLSEYPLDRQKCPLKIGSYARTSAEQPIVWFTAGAIEHNAHIRMAGYRLERIDADYCRDADGLEYTYAKTPFGQQQAKFGCLEAQFYLARQIGYHVVQTYIPTCLIVMISWVGFWIDPKAVPARVSLNFTTLITLMTMGASMRLSLPQVSYAKAIDWWFGACMLFVFAALCEFAMCNLQLRHSEKLKDKAQLAMSTKKVRMSVDQHATAAVSKTKHSIIVPDTGEDNCGFRAAVFTLASSAYRKRAQRLDIVCRLLFPLAWLAFNFIYWSYYMTYGFNYGRMKDWYQWGVD